MSLVDRDQRVQALAFLVHAFGDEGHTFATRLAGKVVSFGAETASYLESAKFRHPGRSAA
jgi:hypothetical protein